MDHQCLKEIFKQCGEVNEIKLFKEDFSHKCYAFVEFAHKHSAEMALKLDENITIENKTITVQKLSHKKHFAYFYNVNKKIFSEKDLRQFFHDNNLHFKEIHLNNSR